MQQTLNIPLKLMKRYRRDKSLWELFAFAVCLKCLKGSSAIHPTVPLVRKLMGCSYYKSQRIIERAKQCGELFRYYPKTNLLIARSLTRGKLKKSTAYLSKKVIVSYSAFCYKFRYEKTDTISHIAVSRSLRDALLVHAIKARQLKNDLHCNVEGKTTIPNSRSNRSTALHSKKLGRIAGCHRSTAIRRLNKMEAESKLTVFRHDFVPVIDHRHDIPLTDDPRLLRRRPFPRHGFLVVKDCNEYFIDASDTHVFVNVIFNHSRRRRVIHKTKGVTFNRQWMDFINR